MTTGLSGTFSIGVNGAGMSGRIYWTEDYNEAANQSTVTARFQVSKNTSSSTTYGTFSGYISIAGTSQSWSGTVSVPAGASNQTIFTKSQLVTHNPDGQLSITIIADGAVSGTSWTDSYGSAAVAMTNFVRLPSAPSAPTLTRTSSGTTVTVMSEVASSPVTPSNYDLRWSYDGATWTEVTGIGTDRTHDITVTSTSTVHAQTRAISSEGTGPWSLSSTIVGIPTAPSSITATRNGRSITVTSGSSSGTGITGYFVQYSTDTGSTWSTAQAMTGFTYSYVNLTPALTYLLRVYSVNSIGSSAYTTASEGIFVPAGGKRWDGSSWLPSSTGKRWDGSAWVDLQTAKRWDGSAWVDLS